MAETTGETPTTAAQSATPANEAPPQAEGEKFDAERAMALIEKLRNEVKELKPKAKKAEEFEAERAKREEAEMTELQKVAKRAAELEARLKAAERASTAQTIAAKVGLPAAFADRLKGETPDEMEADAKAILEALPKPTQKPATPGPVNPGANGKTGETKEQRDERLFGTPVQPFADTEVRRIFWPDGSVG